MTKCEEKDIGEGIPLAPLRGTTFLPTDFGRSCFAASTVCAALARFIHHLGVRNLRRIGHISTLSVARAEVHVLQIDSHLDRQSFGRGP